uniref:Uncharacterized protein n=1 Tax=Triticum urartu TaxID=4572 RepID=A0A8R7UYR1_TRIUA
MKRRLVLRLQRPRHWVLSTQVCRASSPGRKDRMWSSRSSGRTQKGSSPVPAAFLSISSNRWRVLRSGKTKIARNTGKEGKSLAAMPTRLIESA